MQAVLGNMRLEVDRATAHATLRTDVRRLVLVDPLMGHEAALIRKHHLADGARFLQSR